MSEALVSVAPARLAGLAERCDVILCDVYGTLHDATGLFADAVEALRRFRSTGGVVVLVSNSAQPGARLRTSLDRLGLPDDAFDDLVTSSDVALTTMTERGVRTAHHLGTADERRALDDRVVFAAVEDADAVLCTGWPDVDPDDTLALARDRGLDLICTNPDAALRVDGRTLRFAGLVADRYRAIGGTVTDAGKPARAIFAAAVSRATALLGRPVDRERVLGVGDSFALDVGGALASGFHALWITGGAEPSAMPRPPGDAPAWAPSLKW